VGHVVAIDGPAGAGKSTIARGLARRLGWFYLDSGSLYRATAWHMRRLGLDPRLGEDRIRAAREIADRVVFRADGSGCTRVLVGDSDPGDELRTDEMAEAASVIAGDQEVREVLHAVQQGSRRSGNVVAEGRDMGTVVFPDAEVKIYLDARVETRAQRRLLEYRAKGLETDLDAVLAEMKERDDRDMMRAVSPLRAAEDATVVDTSDLGIDDVIEVLVRLVKARIPSASQWRLE